MQQSEVLSARKAANPVSHLIERAIDLIALSAALVAPAAALFALFQFARGEFWLGAAGVVVSALGWVGVHARLIAPFRLRVTRLDIQPPTSSVLPFDDRKPLKIIFFSDIHVGRYKQAAWARKVVELVNAQQPDAVLIGGDLVGHLDGYTLEELLAPLGNLHAPLGVYAVLGNHDYGLPGPDYSLQLAEMLRRQGIRLLRNECVMLNERLQLIGIDELWGGYADVERAFGGDERGIRRLVLGHNPDLMAGIHHSADLFIFGHTHGGQIYLPLLSRFTVPIDGDIFRGQHQLPQGRVYISTGCGETSTPTRLAAPPEIVLINFHA
jgi:uncharacterized protein